jgi:hypothetical protein
VCLARLGVALHRASEGYEITGNLERVGLAGKDAMVPSTRTDPTERVPIDSDIRIFPTAAESAVTNRAAVGASATSRCRFEASRRANHGVPLSVWQISGSIPDLRRARRNTGTPPHGWIKPVRNTFPKVDQAGENRWILSVKNDTLSARHVSLAHLIFHTYYVYYFLHDGSQWRERPVNVQPLDPHGIVQTFRELRLADGSTVPGIDTRSGPIEDWNGSYSGYYLRKFIDPTINAQFTRQDVPWIFFRYAEVLLNYAEASIELGELGDAVDALNQIRRRAGMPDLTAALGQAGLREAYRNERRVELAFEEHRFFDVRRWMIAPEVLSQPARGINIYLEGANRIDRHTWRNHRYEVSVVQQRAWDNRHYFMPIHRMR